MSYNPLIGGNTVLIGGATPRIGVGGPGGASPGATMDGRRINVIDGTPIRVVALTFAAAAGLAALKMAGFRFNVGVSA